MECSCARCCSLQGFGGCGQTLPAACRDLRFGASTDGSIAAAGLGLEALMSFGVGLVDGGGWADQSELGS